MTPHQIALVRQSFADILPIKRAAAALFYDRLFAIEPTTRALFRSAMASQGTRLMAAIAAVVYSLDLIGPMLDRGRALAGRHVRYGVTEAQHASVGAALIWALEQGLGPDFTPEVRAAWDSVRHLLSSAMIEAAAQPVDEAA